MKSSRIQYINPLIIVPLLLKKTAVMYAADKYGWTKIYRLLIVGIKKHIPEKKNQKIVQALVKDSIRMPTKTWNLIQNQEATKFAKKYAEELNEAHGIKDKIDVNIIKFLQKLFNDFKSPRR